MKTNEAPETYPIQFKDKLDEYLWKEHHILVGCCSSIESMKYAVAREVAEKLTDAFIEKAKEFLSKESNFPLWEDGGGNFGCDTVLLIKNFEKDRKGE